MVGATVAWVSVNPSVATVDGNGLVSAAGEGATNITGAAGTTASASVAVVVEQVPNTIVLSAPPDSVAVGDSIQMNAEAFDALDNPIADVTFEWSTSDPAIMTVDQEGWVRARAAGSAEITAAAGTTANATVAVTAVQVPSTIVLSAPPDSVAVGDSIQMTAEAFDALGNAITDVTFEWSSSDPAILAVDQEGWVRAKAAGSAEITVKLGDLSASTSLVSSQDQAQPALERAALEAFYHATNGPEWKNNTNWLTDKPVGQWYGVTTDTAGKVITLHLHQNGLRGRLPAELAQLKSLNALLLWGEWERGLTGPIPPELGRLANLTNLDLGNNELTGEIPPELADLTNLTYLTLTQNKLTGPIPPGLGRLANLERLNLGINRLTGEMPSEIGNLTRLTKLRLNDNDLTGPIPALGRLTNLVHLSLSGNPLTGEIPPEIGNLGKLEWLSISGTDLTGSIPPELGGAFAVEMAVVVGQFIDRFGPARTG